MRHHLLAASLLLLLAAGAAQQRAQGQEQAAGAAAHGAAVAAAQATRERSMPAGAPASTAEHAAPCQRLPFTDEFLHPLEQQKRLEARLAAVQAHQEMQQWLQSFFQTPASELTSTRLADAHRAAEAARAARAAERLAERAKAAAAKAAVAAVGSGAAALAARAGSMTEGANSTLGLGKAAALRGEDAQLAKQGPASGREDEEEPLQERDGFVDVPPPASGCGNSSTCVRAAAAKLLASREHPGSIIRLRWPGFVEDTRRWAAGPGPNGTCLPRQPGEAVQREYLLVVPVGNDISPILR